MAKFQHTSAHLHAEILKIGQEFNSNANRQTRLHEVALGSTSIPALKGYKGYKTLLHLTCNYP